MQIAIMIHFTQPTITYFESDQDHIIALLKTNNLASYHNKTVDILTTYLDSDLETKLGTNQQHICIEYYVVQR